MPIFVVGGITVENIVSLKNTIPFDGVAVISVIMKADNPMIKVKKHNTILTDNTKKHDSKNN